MQYCLLIWLSVIFAIQRTKGQSCTPVEVQDEGPPVVDIPFDSLSPGDGTYDLTQVSGTLGILPGQLDTALHLDGTTVASLGSSRATCFFDPTKCVNGATLAFWLKWDRALSGNDHDANVLSNGGQSTASYGWSVKVDSNGGGNNNQLIIDVSTSITSTGITVNNWAGRDRDWHHVVLVIDGNDLLYYQDGALEDQSTFASRTPVTTSSYNDFLFGAENHDPSSTQDNGQMTLDDLLFWETPQDATFIGELYDSYVSNLPACDPPATCLNGVCTCPDGVIGIDCNATLTFTAVPDGSVPIPENTDVEFSCTGQSDPVLDLWLHDLTLDTDVFNGVTEVGTFTETLTLTQTENGHTFACRGTGTDPAHYIESVETYTFNVEYMPQDVAFTTDTPTSVDQDEGTLVKFTCSVDANPAPLLSLVVRDETGTEVTVFEQTSPELSFIASLHLTKEHHRDVFLCRVAGSAYTLSSDTSYTYNVKYAAQSVELTSDVSPDDPVLEDTVVTLTCQADSYPAPNLNIRSRSNTDNITWYTSGMDPEISTRITLTKDLNADDFYCTAGGTDPSFYLLSNQIRFDVIYLNDTVEISANPASPIAEGTAVQFDCTFDANPLPTLAVMASDGETEVQVSDQTLTASFFSVTVPLTREYHGSEFYCRATGPSPQYNQESSRITYEVTYEADVVTITGDPSPDIELLDNTEVEFTCTADGNPPPLLSLYTRTAGSQDVQQDVQAQAAPTFTTSVTLTDTLDGYDFLCQAQGQSGTIESEALTYSVKYTAQNIVLSTDTPAATVNEDTDVTLTCTAEANPHPRLTVMFTDGQSIQPVSDQAVTGLTLSVPVTVTREHNGGQFFCRATGEDPSYVLDSQAVISYDVIYPPTTTVISSDPSPEISQPVNAVVQVTCSADANPVASLSLLLTDTATGTDQIIYNPANTESFTTSVTLDENHNGESFFCRATGTTPSYQIDSEEISFDVQYEAPAITLSSNRNVNIVQTEGTDVVFTCTVDGNPVPQVSLWTMAETGVETSASGEAFTDTVSTFTITYSKEFNGASFFCKATNDELQYTIHSNTLEFSIAYPATSVDMVTSLPSSDPVEEGTLAYFTCTTDANPEPQLSLMATDKLGAEYVLDTGLTTLELKVLINMVDTHNGDIVFCRAAAQDGSYTVDSNLLPVTINYAPEEVTITTDSPTTATYPEDTAVEITCVVDSNPPPLLSLVTRDANQVETPLEGSETSLESTFPVILTRVSHDLSYLCKAAGTDPEYVLYSESLVFSVSYDADTVSITSDPSPDEPQPENTEVEFTCTADGNPPPLLSLYTRTAGSPDVLKDVQAQAAPTFTTSVILTEDLDQTDFLCTAQLGNSYTIESETVAYRVVYTAQNIVISTDTPAATVNEDTDVTLTCTAEANPHPRLTVMFTDGQSTQPVSDQAVTGLTLSVPVTVTREHNGGQFFCRATGEDPSYILDSESRVTYNVNYIATETMISTDPSPDISQPIDAVVEITCSADANPLPNLSLQLMDTSGQVTSVYSHPSIAESFTTTVTLSSDHNDQKFFCRADGSGAAFQQDSEFVQFDVQYAAPSVTLSSNRNTNTIHDEGTTVVFTCSVDGNPVPYLTLMTVDESGLEASVSGQGATDVETSFTVALTRDHNDEQFFCKTTNEELQYTKHSNMLKFSVAYNVSEVAITTDPTPAMPQPIGGVVQITCSADSNPLPSLSLVSMNIAGEIGHLESSTEATESLSTSVTLTEDHNQEQFFCRAYGPNGSYEIDSEAVQFQVLYAAPNVSLSVDTDTDVLQAEDTEVQFTCTVDGNPVPQVSLYTRDSDGVETSTGETSMDVEAVFTVKLRRNHNDKFFFCKATNEELQYTIHSNSVEYMVEYAASEVVLETDTTPQDAIDADTVVHFTCTTDANPEPTLSLWAVDLTGTQYLVSTNEAPSLMMILPITLAKEYNRHLFFCRATGQDDSYNVDSNTIRYYVEYAAELVSISTGSPVSRLYSDGSAVEITCSTDAYPPPKLSLLARTGDDVVQEISEQFQTSTKFVSSVVLSPASNDLSYFCRAEGSQPEYVLYSSTLDFSVEYSALEVSLTSSHSTEDSLPENTEVTLTCTTDSNPVSQLSLVFRKDGVEEELQVVTATTMTTTVTLVEQHSGGTFFCRAEGTDPEFSTESTESYTYTVTTDNELVLPLALGLSLGTLFLIGLGAAACALCRTRTNPVPRTTAQQPITYRYYTDQPYFDNVYQKQRYYPDYVMSGGY